MEYETEEKNPDCLNKGPCYNIAVYSKFYGTVFVYFIENYRIDRHNLMCSITEHYKKQPKFIDDKSSGGFRAKSKNTRTAELQ